MPVTRRNILIFSLTFYPYVGGAEVAIKEITDRLPHYNWTMITARLDKKNPAEEQMGNIKVIRVGWGGKLDKYLFPWLAVKKAKTLHAKKNFKVAWGMMAFWAGWAALKFKEMFPEVKYVLTLQSGDSDEFIRRRTWFWAKRYAQIYQKPDYITAISNYLIERAKKFGYAGDITRIPNGVDLKLFMCRPGVPHKDKAVIVTTSRLVEKNGIEDLIKSSEYLQIPHEIRIIGAGKLENSLKAMAGEHVKFLGNLNHDEIVDNLCEADVFARPSLSEGLGNAFLEAMAVGVPVVGTKVGGIPDFLEDRKTGLFCEVSNPQSIAEKIEELLNDKALRGTIVKSARELIEKYYGWDQISQSMDKVFQEVAS
ncbi:MAG: hypothetical protein COT81_04605 [Candidatus Buchananbacteria bacterium CG10_big_fil_rev_8_21_14_0_10_42_9]|uniref:Glycosyl transferase family 1 domain-containing protein n=1 Tax=Candidatus Buchananbacteria bacterium CG10_big_fil_rev_8_21_14_0_10_42_9 TaxID=1974526 RepID=A0A2H0W2E9_9BACT|nr:MAG: hypothetical protein COT81_04605 [Candidatus Buchananbacteria bacterium CG10_big_fil_rev_8_21_14_0_10_42_9]